MTCKPRTKTQSSTSTMAKTSFLDLPREIRDAIYNLVLLQDTPIGLLTLRPREPHASRHAVHHHTDTLEPTATTQLFATLRATSRQIDAEAQQRFFDDNVFHFRAHQRGYDARALDGPAPAFVLARVRQLVVEYAAGVADDLFGYMCVQVTMAFRYPREGAGWQLRRCPAYDHRNQRPPEQIYGGVEARLVEWLRSKAEGELLGSEGVKRIVGIIDRELLRVM